MSISPKVLFRICQFLPVLLTLLSLNFWEIKIDHDPFREFVVAGIHGLAFIAFICYTFLVEIWIEIEEIKQSASQWKNLKDERQIELEADQ